MLYSLKRITRTNMARKKHKFIPRSRAVRIRELVLLGLLFVLAGVTLYISSSHDSTFGLLSEPVRQNFPKVVTQFQTNVLDDPAFLSLELNDDTTQTGTQTSAELEDPKIPPEAVNISAFNENTGDAIVLEWTKPDSSLSLKTNIYRSTSSDSTPTLVAEHLDGMTWVDTTVEAKTTYTYQVTMANEVDGTWYESSKSLQAIVEAKDTINPLPPTNVTVERTTTDDGSLALKISWTQPANAAEVEIYRSSIYGNRGSLLTTVDTTEAAQYLDTTAKANVQYWYTLVSVDASQNVSSGDFAFPAPGNKNPFDYTTITGE